jgi:hypothetical protein
MKLTFADLHQFVSLSVELHSVTYHNLNVDHHVNFKSCFLVSNCCFHLQVIHPQCVHNIGSLNTTLFTGKTVEVFWPLAETCSLFYP